MGKLLRTEIENKLENGEIVIDPPPKKINPNSVNLSIAPRLLVYKPRRWFTPWRKPLVWGQNNPPDDIVEMPATGYLIRPGWFYLGRTVETTRTFTTVPALNGRSSGGRVSLHIHATAGFGDLGFEGTWTMELYCIIHTIIFPNTPICQISYDVGVGELTYLYQGKYQNQVEPTPHIPDLV
jgi:dCTP deaminase